MARTTAPLFGFEAQGAVGKAVVYGRWRGIKYARRYVIPANPQTTAQTTTRTTFATLREMWKIMPAIGRAPWDAFAAGRPFLGLNAFIGENMLVVRGDANFNDFLGSPGARGGLAPANVVIAQGSGSGEVDVTVTNPTLPSGWSFEAAQAVAFPNQDPAVIFGGPLVAAEENTANTLFTLTGLGSAVACQVAAWIKYTKPNGEIAYSVGTTDQVTSGA